MSWARCLAFCAVATFLLPFPAPAADPKGLAADGKTLWAHLAAVDYRSSFTLWPGTKDRGPGRGHHGSVSSTWVNRDALSGINGKRGEMPIGSIVVKENCDKAGTLQNVTVMYKARSYNPAAGNWFWARYGVDGEIQVEGRVTPCIGCHEEKKDDDYMMTGPIR